MKRNVMKSIALCGALLFPSAQAKEEAKPKEGQSKVQIAILLDTSGSMSGLIEQTNLQDSSDLRAQRGWVRRICNTVLTDFQKPAQAAL